MKKKSVALFLAVYLALSGLSPAWAASTTFTYTWLDKLKRGAINIVSFPVEVAREVSVTTNDKNLLVGWTVGLVHGLGEGVLRFGAGAIDLVTFPFNFPDSRKAPLVDPEYVWQKPGPKYI